MVRLRPHHLLCMLTYVGKGYGPRFVANYDFIVARLNAGEGIRVVEGPDEICAGALDLPGCHCRDESVRRRDAQARSALQTIVGPLEEMELSPRRLAMLRARFTEGSIRSACAGCEWFDLCSRVAGSGYAQAKLRPAAGSRAPCS